jgi:puromycin-sensitive aminopeptidase
MAMACVDAYRPEWRRWAAFAASRDNSMDTDGLRSTRPIEFPVASPEDADAMFDVITYSKGASVLRMLQQFLGAETFRRGISRYLRNHAYGNAETHHLWEALEEESDQPVRAIMDSWIFQGGHPRIDVAATDNGFTLRQERFQFIGESTDRWRVPVRYRTDAGESRIVVFDEVTIPPAGSLFVNSGGDGYFRTRYVGALHDEIGRVLPALSPEERHLVVADAWANTLAGDTSASSFLELIATLGNERDVEVLGAMVGGISELNRVISSDGRPALQQFVRSLVAPAAADVGWEAQPGESDLERRFRGAVLKTCGVLGDDEPTIAEARSLLGGVLDGTAVLDGEVAAAAIDIVASNGDASDHARFAAAMGDASSPQDRERYLNALAAIPDVASAHATLQMVLDGHIRSQNSMRTVYRLIGNRVVGVQMWNAVKDSWDELLAIMPPFSARNMIGSVHVRSEPDVAADIRQWLEHHPLPGGDQLVAQQLERLAVRVMLRKRAADLEVPEF